MTPKAKLATVVLCNRQLSWLMRGASTQDMLKNDGQCECTETTLCPPPMYVGIETRSTSGYYPGFWKRLFWGCRTQSPETYDLPVYHHAKPRTVVPQCDWCKLLETIGLSRPITVHHTPHNRRIEITGVAVATSPYHAVGRLKYVFSNPLTHF